MTAAASLHLNLAVPNVGVQEHVGASAAEVFVEYSRPVGGRMAASDRPGLGVEIDRAAAARIRRNA